jgi:hypothetical protein
VASSGPNLIPSVALEHLDDFSDLHESSDYLAPPNFLRLNCAPAKAGVSASAAPQVRIVSGSAARRHPVICRRRRRDVGGFSAPIAPAPAWMRQEPSPPPDTLHVSPFRRSARVSHKPGSASSLSGLGGPLTGGRTVDPALTACRRPGRVFSFRSPSFLPIPDSQPRNNERNPALRGNIKDRAKGGFWRREAERRLRKRRIVQ